MSQMDTQTKAVLVTERIFDAPREAVWRAWTEPALFMRWWGPSHFTSPSCQMDVRPGGRYLWCMRGPDGRDNYSAGVFNEVVPPERLVFTDSFADEHGNVVSPTQYGLSEDFPTTSTLTVTLEDLGGRTRLRLFTDTRVEGEMGDMATTGWNQSLDKLAASLAPTEPHVGDMGAAIDRAALTITLTRAFDAPRDLVWRAMTEPELLARWWGRGNPTDVIAYDLRPGGAWRFVEHAPDGDYAFRGEFRELEPPDRIVRTFEYEPWAGHIIVEMMVLTEYDGGTFLTAISQFNTLEDLEGMAQSGMEAGAAESYRHLEALLRSLG